MYYQKSRHVVLEQYCFCLGFFLKAFHASRVSGLKGKLQFFIHSFTLSTHIILVRVMVYPELMLDTLAAKSEYSPQMRLQSIGEHHAHTNSHLGAIQCSQSTYLRTFGQKETEKHGRKEALTVILSSGLNPGLWSSDYHRQQFRILHILLIIKCK